MKRFDGASLPSVALGKGFTECMGAFAECMGHSAKRVAAVVRAYVLYFLGLEVGIRAGAIFSLLRSFLRHLLR